MLYGWKYSYDDVYRLVKEQRYNVSNHLPVWNRGYAYNGAGDRTAMSHFNGSTTATASYTYNELRQLTSVFDMFVAPMAQAFAYDANGNRTSKVAGASNSLSWDADRRMVGVQGEETLSYDHAGQRLYSLRNEGGAVPYRYFFTGLNEEIVKRGVTGAADAFAFNEPYPTAASWYLPVGGAVTQAHDETLSRSVMRLNYPQWSQANFWSPWQAQTKRMVSFWIKRTDTANNPMMVGFYVNTNGGYRYVELVFSPGTDGLYTYGTEKYHQLFYGISPQDKWQRIEVDLGAVIAREAGQSFASVGATYLRGVELSISPLRFSNSYTTTYNSLIPSALNPIASQKKTTNNLGKLTNATTWLHYNHIGNVMGTTNVAGAGYTPQYMDAFGNIMTQSAANSTGIISPPNTDTIGITAKPYNTSASAYYFYQRWYDPRTGAFTSQDPNPPYDQLPYGFNWNNAIVFTDNNGMQPQLVKSMINFHVPNAVISAQNSGVRIANNKHQQVTKMVRHMTGCVDCHTRMQEQHPEFLASSCNANLYRPLIGLGLGELATNATWGGIQIGMGYTKKIKSAWVRGGVAAVDVVIQANDPPDVRSYDSWTDYDFAVSRATLPHHREIFRY